MANAVRTELGEFIRARKLNWKPIAEQFHQERGERLEDTTDPEPIRKLLRQLRKQYPLNPDGERALGDACSVLGLNHAAMRGRFIAAHQHPPSDIDQSVVSAFIDLLHDEAAQAEAASAS